MCWHIPSVCKAFVSCLCAHHYFSVPPSFYSKSWVPLHITLRVHSNLNFIIRPERAAAHCKAEDLLKPLAIQLKGINVWIHCSIAVGNTM